jgi:hypothetical protein
LAGKKSVGPNAFLELAQLVLLRLGNGNPKEGSTFSDKHVRITGWNQLAKRPLDRKGNKLPFSDMVVCTSGGSPVLLLRECLITDFGCDEQIVSHLQSLIPLEIIAKDADG